MYSNELIRGTLKTIILKLLSNGAKMYGYEITQKVRELSKDKIMITEGALYPLLHQLEAEDVLSVELVSLGKRVRKYYKLTDKGDKKAKEKVSEFADFIITMQRILDLKPELKYA